MKVYMIWEEGGEYENRYETQRGIFATRVLADEHLKRLEETETGPTFSVREVEILETLPAQVTKYIWSDHIAADGAVSPEVEWGPLDRYRAGRNRSEWASWGHETKVSTESDIRRWSALGTPDLYVETAGIDRREVEAKHNAAIAEAQRRVKAAD